MESSPKKQLFQCSHCNHIPFADQKGLRRHLTSCHKDVDNDGKMKCAMCDTRFNRMTALTTHIEKNHDVSITSSELSFANYDDFLVWKTNEEESSMSCFVQHGGAITSSSMIRYRYLYCNRSGIFESKGKGKRSMKMQQSSKMGAMCTAHIKVEENLQSGSCKIQYYSTHVGHKNEFAHLPIPNKLKQDIAAQIKLGVSVDKIMDKMRDVSGLDTIKRKHLVVRQDVLNIKCLVNLDNVQKHVNDQTSVALWVEEARKFAYNPVLVFKPQGEKAAIVGEVDDLCEDSFLLGLQTEYQRDMMQKFGNNCICMDATHGTTVYDFFLVTVMVLDDYGEGIPVAWAITNSEDTSSLVQFLKPLREQVGEIHPTIFMSDDAEQFFTSWCGVFGLGAKKLLCSWHVDRAWRNAIHEHVPDKQLKLEVYHMLRLLLLELSIEKFHLLLPQVLTFFQERCTRFYEYMTRTYTNRVSQWAACYRVNTQINTNMMVEAFHRVLKIVYLEHKQNRRVDTLLHTLMKINRDACFNSLRKQEFGKQSHRLSEIKKRHVSATKMLEEGNTDIQKSTCDTWKVKSETSDCYYTVTKVTDGNAMCSGSSCNIRCITCNVCVHEFMCNCLDAVLHSTICKHTHLLSLQFPEVIAANGSSKTDEHTDTSASTLETAMELEGPSISNIISNAPTTSDASTSRKTVLARLDELRDLIDHSSEDVNLTEVNSHIRSAIALVKAKDISVGQLMVKKRPAPNANSITQQRFHSTKKKRKVTSNSISKPTNEEEIAIKSQLESKEVTVCGICYKTNDSRNADKTVVEWIQCPVCSLWVHQSCAGRLMGTLDIEKFQCEFCAKKSTS